MNTTGPERRGRTHDAEGARRAILNAAEEVFAEHGFDGARIDAIATRAGYNKSLIFQYFGDKLKLYAEVLKRADRETNELQVRMLAPWFADENLASDAHAFRTLLETTVALLFDYLVENPRLGRILLWEMAEGWQTYTKIYAQFIAEDIELFGRLFHKARSAGLLRSDFTPMVQLSLALQICQTLLAYMPVYQMVLPGEDFSSPEALAKARKYLVTFIVSGIMPDLPPTT
jgi:TetR/AcrR family transcriptional regulator